MDKDFIKLLYSYCFSILLFMTFFMLPFTYFYSEEKSADYDIDLDYEKTDSKEKIFKALKNTVFFVLILALIIIMGLIIRPESRKSLVHGKEVEWVR